MGSHLHTCATSVLTFNSPLCSAFHVRIMTHAVVFLKDVEFSPPLPEKKVRALKKMGMCSVAKVILKFDRQVLPPLLHGCICSDSFIPEFWFRCVVHLPQVPRLVYHSGDVVAIFDQPLLDRKVKK